ncbi:MAG: dihydrolipoyl dehydrogenase [Bacteroidia bacterium]|nr:dihydrolipoyl dehydrogenase [Bacteroidia bacterium]
MNYDILIIGSGPGGYVAAIRSAQLGMKTGVIEKAELGGVCLNWGCIPTKSLLKSAQVYEYLKHAYDYGINCAGEVKPDFPKIIERSRTIASNMSKGIQYLFKKNKIDYIPGFGWIRNNHTVEVENNGIFREYSAKHIVVATGARSKELPNLKIDGTKVIGYRDALTLTKLPETMLVVGSGAIGAELAYFYNAMGTKVTLIELLPDVVPLEDEEISRQLARSLKKAGIEILLESTVEQVDTSAEKCKAFIKGEKGDEIREAEIILSAVGVTPNIENIGLEDLRIEIENAKIKTDEFYRTNIPGINAIGDIVHGPALAHVASAQGIICVEKIAGKNPEPLDYENIPSCVYTNPEIASVGMTEKTAKEKGYELIIGKFPFIASGKANTTGERDGFVKLLFDAKTWKLLGAHLIGANVTEMISGLVVARKLGITAKGLSSSIHPHPTISEAVMEAAAAAMGEAIHL